MAWALFISAFIVDLIELVGGYISFEIIATIIGIVASFVFWVWFLILGVTYTSNTKVFASSLIMNVGEVIPGLDAIPFWFLWTIGMLFIVTLTRMEDRGQEPTILGAFRRIGAWTSVPAGIGIPMLIGQTYRDRKRVSRQRLEKRKENEEIMEHPERMQEIKEKYAGREEQFKKKELSMGEKAERKLFKITPKGIEKREEGNPEHKRIADNNNVLDLKNGLSGWTKRP